jgi:hypothetical protein
MWNGYDARLVDARGAHRCGIEHVIGMVGRGVLLDVARLKGVAFLEDGYPITSVELDATAEAQGVEVRRGDFCIVRTGQMEERLARGEWGTYAGGAVPGLAFETFDWIFEREAAICAGGAGRGWRTLSARARRPGSRSASARPPDHAAC